MKTQILMTGLLVATLACSSPAPEPKKISNNTSKPVAMPTAALSTDRWQTAIHPKLAPYPGIAHFAGISGVLTMRAVIDGSGAVIATSLLSGPPQLASYLDKHIRQIQFKPLSEDGQGPWSFTIVGDFELGGKIAVYPQGEKETVKPTGVAKMPHER